MLFLVHDKETGRIEQSNKLYAWQAGIDTGRKQDHGDLLNDMGQHHIAVESPVPLDSASWYVGSDKLPTERPIMQINMSAARIRAGENYASILTGIPKGAAVVIRARSFNEPLHSLVIDDGRLEISVPTPGVYTVEVTKFPYIDWFAILEVTQ